MSVLAALKFLVKPGMTVVEGGAGEGEITVELARSVGAEGRVHTFEPYRELREQAVARVSGEGLESRVSFHDALLGNAEGEAEFYAAPEPSAVFSTRNRELLHFHPDADRRLVPITRLDATRIAADVVYLDTEGGEFDALLGARELLAGGAPDLLLHTHGNEVDGIAGTVAELAGTLSTLGYTLWDVETGWTITARRYADQYAIRMGVLAASRRIDSAEALADFVSILGKHS